MSKSTTDLCSIARAGGGISISSSKSTTDLCSIARAGNATNAALIIRNADQKSTTDLCSIARASAGNVTFEFE
ncbi:MAG: hypothetical protein V4573_00575 [Pseudomonadota bacterium]